MQIKVMSQKAAEEYCASVTGHHSPHQYAVISITSPGEKTADIRTNDQITLLHCMCFYDLDKDFTDSAGKQYTAVRKDDIKGLKAFVDTVKRKSPDILIIHCGAGISRSAGIAAAIEDYLHLPDTIWNNPRYQPNRRVYQTALEELGIRPDKNDIQAVFDSMTKGASVS